MKQSIKWHQRSLESCRDSLKELADKLVRLQAEIDNLTCRCVFLDKQIYEATRLKKESFDADKFLCKKMQTIVLKKQ